MLSQPPYIWCHIQYTCDILSTLWHHIHYVWQHNTVCCWYDTRHMCDIICTTDDITSTLSHQTTVFMISHALQAWYHTHYIRHPTQGIFVITTSQLISHPLFNDITSSLYDLKPPCLCHHSHYIWHLVHCICVITSTVLMISHQL